MRGGTVLRNRRSWYRWPSGVPPSGRIFQTARVSTKVIRPFGLTVTPVGGQPHKQAELPLMTLCCSHGFFLRQAMLKE
eukprot:scaffold251712_cov33-Tisochrysis_lutea.AAC.3